jgi:protein Xni
MPEELRPGLHRYKESFSNRGVSSVEREGTEADDVIATLAVGVANHAGRSIILSTDTVYCQLLAERIHVRDHFDKRELDEEYVRKKFGVAPEQLVDFWALAGSGTTHIPGVPGIGAKTAKKLLDEHGSLAAVLEAAPTIPGKLGDSLRAHADRARLSRELARLRCDLELGWNLKDFRLAR